MLQAKKVNFLEHLLKGMPVKKIVFFCMSFLSFATTQSEAMFQNNQVVQKISYGQFNNKYEDLIKNYHLFYDEIESDEDKAQFDIYVTKLLIDYINNQYVPKKDPVAQDLNEGRQALSHFFPNLCIQDENKLVQMILDFLRDMKDFNVQPSNLHLAMIAENCAGSVIAKYENKGLCLVL